jgi:hypothetical protein
VLRLILKSRTAGRPNTIVIELNVSQRCNNQLKSER